VFLEQQQQGAERVDHGPLDTEQLVGVAVVRQPIMVLQSIKEEQAVVIF
jgi:hypothetical protein